MSISKEEQKIINQIETLKTKLEKLHSTGSLSSGGSLSIGRAFKNLGSSVKQGLEHSIVKPLQPTINYITSKKGLASTLVNQGIPIVTSTTAGILADTFLPETGLLGGVVAGELGNYAGNMAAQAIDKKAGTGLKKRGRPKKVKPIKVEIQESEEFTEPENASLKQYMRAMKSKSDKDLKSSLKSMANDIERIKIASGAGLVKGSEEAKEKMRRVREAKKK